MHKVVLSGWALLLPVIALPAAAQSTSAQTRLGVTTAYVFRGITRAGLSAPMEQRFFLRLGRPAEAPTLSAGVWANLEFAGDSTHVSDRGPNPSIGFGEFDFDLHATASAGPADISLGVIHFQYPRPAVTGDRPRSRTTEITGSVHLRRIWGSPRVLTAVDLDQIKGIYLEANGNLPILGIGPVPPIFLNLRPSVGLSYGQSRRDQSGVAWLYDRNGVEFIGLALTSDFHQGPFAIVADFSAQANLDDETRRKAGGNSCWVKFWLSINALYRW